MKPVFDFLEQDAERDEMYYYNLYLLLMKELNFEPILILMEEFKPNS